MPTPEQIKRIKGITNPLIKERYLEYFGLPQDVRQMIFAVKTANDIWEIGQKRKLNEDQIRKSSHITGMVLLGETNIVDFVRALKEKCNLDNESARQLARDINSAIFLPVKESLKKIHKVDEWPREDEGREDQRVVTLEEKKPEINNNVLDLRKEE